jgi:WD40 repeat protein
VVVSPDGTRIASGIGNNLKVWNTKTGKCELTRGFEWMAFEMMSRAWCDITKRSFHLNPWMHMDCDSVDLVFFSPDGSKIVSCSAGSFYFHTNRYYCGRHLGSAAIPGSDGRCGPNNGPQCQSCVRFQARPGTTAAGGLLTYAEVC